MIYLNKNKILSGNLFLKWGTGVITPVKPPAGALCDAISIIKTMFLLYPGKLFDKYRYKFVLNLILAAMAELVDALGSGSSRRTPVRVRVPLAADILSSITSSNYT